METENMGSGIVDLKRRRNEWIIHFCVAFFAGILCYMPLFSNMLTNQYDGLWLQSDYQAGAWEISLGRWFWPVLDMIRLGYSGDPLNSYLCIAAVAFGNIFLFDAVDFLKDRRSYLCSVMIMVGTTVSTFLSYRFMSPTFGISYLLSVAAVWVLCKGKRRWLSAIVAALLACLSLGCYQTNIGCTCLMILMVGIIKCVKEQNFKEHVLLYLVRSAIVVIVGCGLYAVVWKAVMLVTHVEAADYRGAGNISPMYLVASLPRTIVQTFNQFVRYFFTLDMKHTLFQESPLYSGLLLILGLGLVAEAVFTCIKDFKRGIFILLYTALIPPACNFSLMLAPDNRLLMQMTLPLALLTPVLLCTHSLALPACLGKMKKAWRNKGLSIVLTVLCGIMLYGNLYQTGIDMTVLYEGHKATETIVSNAVSTAIGVGQYDLSKPYLIIGVPADNPSFKKPNLWKRANSYAQYGNWWTAENSLRSYRGMIRELGIYWIEYGFDNYAAFVSRYAAEIQRMEVYPAASSIKQLGGVTVIKMSDTY